MLTPEHQIISAIIEIDLLIFDALTLLSVLEWEIIAPLWQMKSA
jgi:hypothetical protein